MRSRDYGRYWQQARNPASLLVLRPGIALALQACTHERPPDAYAAADAAHVGVVFGTGGGLMHDGARSNHACWRARQVV